MKDKQKYAAKLRIAKMQERLVTMRLKQKERKA